MSEKQIEYTHVLHKSVLELNEGQLEGLPKNPRYIRDEKFAKLKLSLETSPEFLKANPLRVYPLDNGKYIIIDGNMRYLAGNEIGITEYPCYIFKKETPIAKLKEFLIKANIAYGNTDWDALANDDWDVKDLEDWGMDVDFLHEGDDLDPESFFKEVEDAEASKEVVEHFTIEVPEAQVEHLEAIKEAVKVTLEEWEGCKIK